MRLQILQNTLKNEKLLNRTFQQIIRQRRIAILKKKKLKLRVKGKSRLKQAILKEMLAPVTESRSERRCIVASAGQNGISMSPESREKGHANRVPRASRESSKTSLTNFRTVPLPSFSLFLAFTITPSHLSSHLGLF